MSKYKIIEYEFTRADLKAALDETRVVYEEATTENGLNLVGYHGDTRPEKATFVVRRAHLDNASNDLGFQRTEAGKYVAVISSFDSNPGRKAAKLVAQCKDLAATNSVIRMARDRGMTVERVKTAGGAIRLRLHGRA